MPSTIITKNGSGAPLAADLVAGELAVDLTNGRLYTEDSGGSVIEIGLNPSGNLDVTGTVSADGLTIDSSSGITVNGPTDQDGKLNLVAYAGVQDAEARIQAVRGNTSGTDSRLQFLTNNGTSLLTRVDINDNGNISFYDDTGVSQSFFWDASAESLGIGTTSPFAKLSVTGASASENDSGIFQITDGTGANTDSKIVMGVVSSDYGWIQAVKPGTDVLDLALNPNGGNVGIGTTSPGGKLSIRATSFAGSDSHFGFGANNDIYLTYGSTGNTIVRTIDGLGANSEKMRIDSSGNVGIGATSPSFAEGSGLEIERDSASATLRLQRLNTGASGLEIQARSSEVRFQEVVGSVPMTFHAGGSEAMRIDSSGDIRLTGTAPNAEDSISTVNFYNSSSSLNLASITGKRTAGGTNYGSLIFNTTSAGSIAERMRIDSSGNVSIGGITPTGLLTLGTGSFSAAAANTSALYTSSTAGLVAVADGFLLVDRAGADVLKVDTSGNLLVGTGSVINTGKVCVEFTGASKNGISLKTTTASNGSKFVSFADSAGIEIGYIEENTSTSVNYSTSSDQRLKENIVDAPSASDDIDAIQVRSFDWKADGSHQKYGMVAQELVTVAPNAVSQPEDPEAMMGVDYSKLVPMMLKEIQQLRARVAQLEGAN